MADDDESGQTEQGEIAPVSAHPATSEPGKAHSPFVSEGLAKMGGLSDIAGKAVIGFAGIGNLFAVDRFHVTPVQFVYFSAGMIFLLLGVYLQAESKR